MKTLALIPLCLLLTTAFAGSAADDLVKQLPDMDAFPFNFYSGYLDLPDSGKHIHYFFEESLNEPSTDPLVLWLQGGPGCSGLTGWATEHGYFVNRYPNQWTANPYTWNNKANMIYFEAPAGVGFSYADKASETVSDDPKSAADNLASMVQFLAKFPAFRKNEFYISGESYGGIYVPYLAYYIIEYNKKVSDDEKINLKGIIVGNGCTDWKYDTEPATVEIALTHALTSKETQIAWEENQCTVPIPTMKGGEVAKFLSGKDTCTELLNKINNDMNNLDPYDIYYVCTPTEDQIEFQKNAHNPYAKINSFVGAVPCNMDSFVTKYFNRDDVREALHISSKAASWGECANIDYTIDYSKGSIWAYPTFFQEDLRVWVYSGDVDAVVPYPGTRNWINYDLKLPITNGWRQWMSDDGSVAGYIENYEGLTFLTVRGAGHMVPEFRPSQAYKMFQAFLDGNEDLK